MLVVPVGGAKPRLLPSCSTIAVLAALALPVQAQAAGTRAGSTISNTASASFDTGAGTTTVDSNRVELLVDELLDVTVDSSNPADVPTTPGATGQLLTRSEEHTSELQSLMRNSYAVFCLKKKTKITTEEYKPH